MSDEGKTLNRLAREQMKMRLLADIACDMQVCELEGMDHTEYAAEIMDEVSRIAFGFRKGSELIRWDHVCGRCGGSISIFKDTCPECGARFDMSRPFERHLLEDSSGWITCKCGEEIETHGGWAKCPSCGAYSYKVEARNG